MISKKMLLKKRQEILKIASKHGAKNVRIFGSVAKNQEQEKSDVDFLVEFEKNRSLLDHSRMLQDLQDLLCCKVDLVEPEGLHWYIKDKILKEAQKL